MRLALQIVSLLLGSLFFAEHILQAADPAEVPIKIHRGRVVIPARINGTNQSSFLLDSGCTITTLHPDLVDELGLTASGDVRINGIAGEERGSTYRGLVFEIGTLSYTPSRVASIPSERNQSRRRSDGVLGSGFLRRFVVEIEPKSKLLRLHSPTNFNYKGRGEILTFTFKKEVPVVKATILLPGKDPIEGEFEIDTGCDSGLCLGNSFVKRTALLDSSKTEADKKFGIGGSVSTRSGSLPLVRLGKLDIKDAQTDFFLDGSPVDEPLAGHIGMGVLKNYKVIFDYSRKQLILEP